MKLTLSVIKADTGSIGGHVRPPRQRLDSVNSHIRQHGMEPLPDSFIRSTGDDIAIVTTHTPGVGAATIRELCWHLYGKNRNSEAPGSAQGGFFRQRTRHGSDRDGFRGRGAIQGEARFPWGAIQNACMAHGSWYPPVGVQTPPVSTAKEKTMATLKVIELLAQSEKSWEDAAQVAVAKASDTLHNIKSIYIKEMEAQVENNKITEYRINAKISFELD